MPWAFLNHYAKLWRGNHFIVTVWGKKNPLYISSWEVLGTQEHTDTCSTQQKTFPILLPMCWSWYLCMGGDKILILCTLRKRWRFHKNAVSLGVIKVFARKSLTFIDRDLSFEVSGRIPIGLNKFGIAVPASDISICELGLQEQHDGTCQRWALICPDIMQRSRAAH